MSAKQKNRDKIKKQELIKSTQKKKKEKKLKKMGLKKEPCI